MIRTFVEVVLPVIVGSLVGLAIVAWVATLIADGITGGLAWLRRRRADAESRHVHAAAVAEYRSADAELRAAERAMRRAKRDNATLDELVRVARAEQETESLRARRGVR